MSTRVMKTKMVKIERLGGVVEARFLGFMAGRGYDDSATYDGEQVAVLVPGEEFITTIHWSRVQDPKVQEMGRAYVAAEDKRIEAEALGD